MSEGRSQAMRNGEVTVDAGEVSIAVRDYGGTGTDVLLLHGGGRTKDDWDQVATLLHRLDYRPVAVDMRGHGRSGRADWIWAAVLDDIAAVVEHLELRQPAVVGHSLGGMVAALWAGRDAECPLAANLDGHGNPTRPEQLAGFDPAAAASALAEFGEFLTTMAEAVPPFLRDVMHQVDALDLIAVYRAARCPLIVASGRHEELGDLLPAALRPAWRAYDAWLDAQLAGVEADVPLLSRVRLSTGHDPHLEDPESLTNLLAGYLSQPATQAPQG